VKQLKKTTLLTLLQTYKTAISELERLRDPSVAELLRRMKRHKDELIAALAAQTPAA
jgi:hypothetical protein